MSFLEKVLILIVGSSAYFSVCILGVQPQEILTTAMIRERDAQSELGGKEHAHLGDLFSPFKGP